MSAEPKPAVAAAGLRPPRGEPALPLCVDLDETLVCTDLLWEATLQLARRPSVAWRALLALLTSGKAAFKEVVMTAVPIAPATLPYREEVLEYLRSQWQEGRAIVLATASHRVAAERIAEHLGIFSGVLATNGRTNLSGRRKQAALEAAYGKGGFDYIGDGPKDLPALASARSAMLVAPSSSLRRKAEAQGNVAKVFADATATPQALAKALRLHQWAKNALLVVPLIAAHRVFDLQAWLAVAMAFLAYGLVASGTYVLNDLLDLPSDRLHAHKRKRPFASGRLAVQWGIALVPLLVLGGFAFALALPRGFFGFLLAYCALTLGYSLDFKRRMLVDVLSLALLYTVRILAGAAAIEVAVSEWLLMFSLFIFISLAFLKRMIELKDKADGTVLSGRGYSIVDLDTMRVIGVCSGLVSVLVFALYISSPATSMLYRAPQALWLMCPLLIYWISRIWFLAARGYVHHDPVVFALSDWRSYVVGAAALAVLALAALGVPGQ